MAIDLLLVDGLNLIRRIYAAQPDTDDQVEDTLRGAINGTLRNQQALDATHIAVVFEGRELTWRHKLLPEYKAGRKPMPDKLANALPLMKKAFADVGIVSLEYPQWEADDVIATLANKVADAGLSACILSTDKGFCQLIGKNVIVRDHFKRRNLDALYVTDKYGVEPHLIADSLALAGDTTNNIPGVPGVGLKTAAKLLAEYGDLDQVLIEANNIGGRIGDLIFSNFQVALLARKLVLLKTDCELGISLSRLRYNPPGNTSQD
jgi:protein Xni